MFDGSVSNINDLIEPGRVHRDVYTDPDLFELEMDRIFGQAWIYVGHDSQIPNTGDFITTEIGRQPVILIRHSDGNPKLLINRCSHRGAKVLNETTGNAKSLTCLYHGWSFGTDGACLGVSMPEGCAEGFNKKDFGLSVAPRLG
ncbi:MAG: aromatic ring-hydroxylating oxygenase subunit alpha, partial [Alphaproteobacteria bacterium]